MTPALAKDGSGRQQGTGRLRAWRVLRGEEEETGVCPAMENARLVLSFFCFLHNWSVQGCLMQVYTTSYLGFPLGVACITFACLFWVWVLAGV